jgi:ATP-binding cassette subfamily B protein
MSQLPSLPRRSARSSSIAGGDRPRDFKGAFRKIGAEMRRYSLRIALAVLLTVCANALSILGPRILGQATTLIYDGAASSASGGPGIDYAAVRSKLSALFALYSLSAAFSYFVEFLMGVVIQNIGCRLRKNLAAKISRLPMQRMDEISRGEILSRLTNDVDSLSANLNAAIMQSINASVTIAGVTAMMALISPALTVAALAMIPASGWFVRLIVRKSQKQYTLQQDLLGQANGQVEEAFSGIDAIQAFSQEEEMARSFAGSNDELGRAVFKTQFFSGLMLPLTSFIGNASYAMVALFGGYLSIRGAMSVGDIQAFALYVRAFTLPINSAASTVNMLQSTAAAAERVYAFLSEAEDTALEGEEFPLGEAKGDIRFANAGFGYKKGERALKGIDFYAPPGSRVAVVGPTGAGKTTVVKLLLRFYDLGEGKIFVGGHDVSLYSRSSVRKAFGAVLQDAWLFGGTIMENIRFGRPDASDEEVVEASKAACAHGFVSSLPSGYSTVLAEDSSNISQGQRQLLAIARALLCDAAILILDEATSSVDTRTEALISEAVARLTKGKTSFTIAHRLATAKNASQILYIEEGELLECGSHEELLSLGGAYASLYRSQFEAGA